jgi:CRP-like cAMP-binding protein
MDQLHRYTRFLLVQISQTAACNRLHRLEQRLARWLLMTHDHVKANEFHETHEFLSHMLGTDRSEVTIAAGILREAGLISYSRGKVHILDRKGLEAASCDCYQIFFRELTLLRQKEV